MRTEFLPYCLPSIGEEEVSEVVDSLRSGWVTTGPKTRRFEMEFAHYIGARHAIAVNSGTAALHLSLAALGVGPGDEVIVPTMTFCATANVVAHLGARPVIVDVDEDGLLTAEAAARAISSKTRAIIPVHYAGQACDLNGILGVAGRHGIPVIEDAAHAVGAAYEGRKIGVHGAAVAFSFYATKNMTTGEGGMITTNDDSLAALLRRLALHGMSRDAWNRYSESGTWFYEVLEPGYKDNMTDLEASLGLHQLRKLDGFIKRRRELADFYRNSLQGIRELRLPRELPGRRHCYHIYPIVIDTASLEIDRRQFIESLKAAGIGASVHFIPMHRHPYYRDAHGLRPESFPIAERMFHGLLSLPLYPRMTDADATDVVETVSAIVRANRRRRQPLGARLWQEMIAPAGSMSEDKVTC